MAEPPLTLHAIHDDGPGNLQPTRIVIHATCPNIGYPAASAPGRALSTARYFQSPAAGGSAHYVVDPAGEQHCVPDAHIAWHSPPNPRSIGIEICAEGGDYPRSYSRAQWLSDPVWPAVQRAAARTRELCRRFGIPLVKLSVADLQAGRHGICGHVDVSRAFHQSSHTDPGAGFPWPEFMAAVTGGGSVRRGENVLENHRVSGSGSLRLNCPVGKASAITAKGWLSASVDGPKPGALQAWFQDDKGGISDVSWRVGFTNGHSQRPWAELPDGTTMVNIHFQFVGDGCITLETQSR